MSIEKSGPTLLTESTNNGSFSLQCTTNVNSSAPMVLSWTKDGKDILIDDKIYSQTTSTNTHFLNSRLEFKTLNRYNYNAYSSTFKCKATYTSTEVGQPQSVSYFSEPEKIQFTYSEPIAYNVSYSNITVPTIPGLLFELSCQVSGNPRPRIKWLIDGVNYSEKKFESFTDEPFVINITFRDTWHMNHILVFKMDNQRQLAKYECILNDNITIREHYIKVIEEKPKLSVRLDKSSLDDLKVNIAMNVRHTNENFLEGLAARPLKMSILYVENATFSKIENASFNPGFYETIRIAPGLILYIRNWQEFLTDGVFYGCFVTKKRKP